MPKGETFLPILSNMVYEYKYMIRHDSQAVLVNTLTNRTGSISWLPPCCCLSSASVYLWLCPSDPCPFSLAGARPLIIASLCSLRWAQFFICPLMIRDAIDREVEAVDSGESGCLRESLLCAGNLDFGFCALELNFSSTALPSSPHAQLCSAPLIELFCASPSVHQSTSWLSRQTPTGRRCCSAVWPNLDTLWASSAGVSW